MPNLTRDGNEQCWKQRTGLEKKLIIGISVLGALAVIFLLIIKFADTCPDIDDDDECKTKYCVEASAQLLEFIDLKEDPCDNFYRYACGSYYKNAVKKDSPSPWTSTQTLFQNEMKSLVVDPIRRKDTNAHILIKQFYHECMNETKIDEEDNEAFMNAIDELGGWPLINGTDWKAAEFDWVDWYIEAEQLGLPVIGFFNFKRIETMKNDTILRVTGPKIEDDDYPTHPRFMRLMKKIVESFDATYNKADVEDIYKFMKVLNDYRYELEPSDGHLLDDSEEEEDDDDDDDDFDMDDKYVIVRVTMQNLTETCPDVPWLKILNGISGNDTVFDNSSEVAYHMDNIERYCVALQKLLKETHPKVIANYFIWTIIENAHMYMDKDIRRAFDDVTFEDEDRFETCMEEVDKRFKYVKETIYVRKKTNPLVRLQLKEMIEIMKDVFEDHLEDCEWMDEETRKAAVEKAELIESVIGADDELYDIEEFDKILGVDDFKFTSDSFFEMYQQKLIKEDDHFFDTLYGPVGDNWENFFKNAVEVNAFFLPSLNVMIIPAPILSSIFYNKKFPASLNYGAMGSTVGHEFMHGFSIASREVLLENDTVIDWWTNATSEAFDEAVKCVIEEYEHIPFRYRLNGTLTLEENVADYVGADLGFEAYIRWTAKHGKEKKLPGLDLTPEQIYWIQTSTNFCFRKLDDNSVDYEEEDAHAIPAFRVQGPAKNSIYFAQAFNCPVGSPMNPEKKCKML